MKQKIIRSLSPKEVDLLSRLEFEGKAVYTKEELVSFCKDKQQGQYLIKKLLEKKRLKKIIKNTYFVIPIKAPQGKWMPNEYVIAKILVKDSNYYIGYSSVFNSYGFTEQVAQMIYVINDKYSFSKIINGIKFKAVKVKSKKIYGLDTRVIGGENISFPSKERALIDAFEFYNTAKAEAILVNQFKKINIETLIDYVSLYPVQIVRRRMGYFLEKLKVPKKTLNKIDVGKSGYSFLRDNDVKKGAINKRWRVIVNG
ncbi:MAG: hypothetical protein ABH857_03755 [Elusimicrobiota bacterium]